MASKRKRKTRQKIAHVGTETVSKSDFQRVQEYVQENPLFCAAAAGLVAVCLVAGILYWAHGVASEHEAMTRYAQAMATEDPAQRAAELEELAQGPGRWAAEALYMAGESAIRAQEYDTAEAAFRRVREQYPDTEYVPRAVEGLAFLAENRGDLQEALEGYQEVSEKWPGSFAGRCQPLNIARVQEGLGNLGAAIESYQAQTELFPGSHAAAKAQAALERLSGKHPDLFPAEPLAPEPDTETAPETPAAQSAGDGSEAAPDSPDKPETDQAAGSTTAPDAAADNKLTPGEDTADAPQPEAVTPAPQASTAPPEEMTAEPGVTDPEAADSAAESVGGEASGDSPGESAAATP